MARKRFTQIIDKTNNVIPVGGEAQNITLKDGSILEEALGEINLAEKGSIIDQLNKLKADTLTGGYAPIVSPVLQESLSVQEDLVSKQCAFKNSSQTVRGLTVTKKNNNYYQIQGTCQPSTDATHVFFLGAGANTTEVEGANAGDYIYIIKTNCLIQDHLLIRFYYNKATTNDEGEYTDVKEENLEGQDNIKEARGVFTIPSGKKLSRASLVISSTASETITNGRLYIYLYKKNSNLIFNTFKTSNGAWQTQIADKLTVFPYKNGTPTSELGIIQGDSSSSWKGILKVDTEGDSQNGILVRDSGIGFLLSANNNNISKRQTGIISPTNHRIFAGYNSNKSDAIPGIYYDTSNQHNFRIKNSAAWPVVFRLTLSGATFSNSIFVNNAATIKGKLTAQGETDLKTTTVTDLKATNLTVATKFRSNDVPIQVNVTSMKTLEQIINSPTYPVEQMLLLRLQHNVVYYLLTGIKSATSGASSCPAMGFKVNNNNIILFYAGQGKIYRTQYWWPSGQANGNNNRKWTTYSTTLGTDELIGRKPTGEKFL